MKTTWEHSKKILFDINIDHYENGQGIVIKRCKDKKVWARVFSNTGAGPTNAKQWITDVRAGKYG